MLDRFVENVSVDDVLNSSRAPPFAGHDRPPAAPRGAAGGMLHRRGLVAAPARIRRASGRLLIVLDLNGILVDRVRKRKFPHLIERADFIVKDMMIFKRPGVDEFLEWALGVFDVGIWSSCKKNNLDPIIDHLLSERQRSQLKFVLDQDSCDVDGWMSNHDGSGRKQKFVKDLQRVWRVCSDGDYETDVRTTLLIDDSPYKAEYNPVHTAIHPVEYSAVPQDAHHARTADAGQPGGPDAKTKALRGFGEGTPKAPEAPLDSGIMPSGSIRRYGSTTTTTHTRTCTHARTHIHA